MPEAFTIATLLFDGGARLGLCRLPGLHGNLPADLATIAAWKPAIIVSMTEQSEMDRCNCGDLGTAFAVIGIPWVHLPIRDYGGPDGDSKDAWPALSARLHAVLADGGGVLLHCRGGQGRSGMIALRILVERGEVGDDALERLRCARPGAVETEGQLRWALAVSA